MRFCEKFIIIVCLCSVLDVKVVWATASTHIWAPSTDCQAFKTLHITADVYIPVEENEDGLRPDAVTNTGITLGIMPFKKLNGEVGFDYKTGYGDLDSYPIYFNAKLGIPEDAFKEVFKYGECLPSVAYGIYDVGTKSNKTNYNIVYTKVAKTLKVKDFSLGRFSIGYFWGNDNLLLDKDGEEDARGILAAWERIVTEISDKLWVCVEYQGTRSSYGTFNLGGSWQFTPNVGVLGGYSFCNNKSLADTVTVQVDINF